MFSHSLNRNKSWRSSVVKLHSKCCVLHTESQTFTKEAAISAAFLNCLYLWGVFISDRQGQFVLLSSFPRDWECNDFPEILSASFLSHVTQKMNSGNNNQQSGTASADSGHIWETLLVSKLHDYLVYSTAFQKNCCWVVVYLGTQVP